MTEESYDVDEWAGYIKEINGYNATCAKPGQGIYTCEACGDLIEVKTTKAHNWNLDGIFDVTDATCTEAGLTEGKKCSVCGEITLAQEVIASLGHKDENGDFECDVCQLDLCTDHIPADAIEISSGAFAR